MDRATPLPRPGRVARDGEVRVAAIAEDGIIGVGAVVPQLSQLRACYVLREVCRQGVGEAIVRRLEGIARERGASSLTLDASLNAVSFYARLGYERIEQGEHLLSCEVAMPCVKMHKVL